MPPCSSTTTAMCTLRSCISWSSSPTCFTSGVKYGSRMSVRILRVSPLRAPSRSRSFAYTTPTMLSIESSNTGMREWPCSTTRSMSSETLRLASMAIDVDARHHHLSNRLVGHLQDAVDHLLLAVLDHPLLLTEVQHELELLLGDKGPDHALPRVAARSSKLLISVRPPTSGRSSRVSAATGRPRMSASALVEAQRERLRRDLAEHEHEGREDGGARRLREVVVGVGDDQGRRGGRHDHRHRVDAEDGRQVGVGLRCGA